MKRIDFNKPDYDRITVICKHDGDVAFCNALAVNGTCKCDDCECEQAIAVIVEKDHRIQIRDITTDKVIPDIYTVKQYLALED